MTDLEKAARMALEALKDYKRSDDDRVSIAMHILRQALEQPAQQEVDWKDQYIKQKRRADMWVSKYETDIGPLEKAGPVTAQHEPVAWMWKDGSLTSDPDYADGTWTPLYTRPKAREWVGLTVADIYEIADDYVFIGNIKEIAHAIEAKLKEKNNGTR